MCKAELEMVYSSIFKVLVLKLLKSLPRTISSKVISVYDACTRL